MNFTTVCSYNICSFILSQYVAFIISKKLGWTGDRTENLLRFLTLDTPPPSPSQVINDQLLKGWLVPKSSDSWSSCEILPCFTSKNRAVWKEKLRANQKSFTDAKELLFNINSLLFLWLHPSHSPPPRFWRNFLTGWGNGYKGYTNKNEVQRFDLK